MSRTFQHCTGHVFRENQNSTFLQGSSLTCLFPIKEVASSVLTQKKIQPVTLVSLPRSTMMSMGTR